MASTLWVLGEALMDCVAQPDGSLHPLMGGSPFNLARAAALRLGGASTPGGARVGFLNPLSTDLFGDQMRTRFAADGVQTLLPASRLPTSLALVQVRNGQPRYGFYREGVADRDYTVDGVLALLQSVPPGAGERVLHTGSLLLVPPEHRKVVTILQGAKALGWTISVDVNLRPQAAAHLADYLDAVKQVIALADWLKASAEDLEGLEDLKGLGVAQPSRRNATEVAAHFSAQGASRIALTFGSQGAWLQVDGHSAEADVPPVTVVDTVGAGDTFWGNCLGDWVQADGAAQRVAQTLREAMQAAALNCAQPGCQPPAYAQVIQALAARFGVLS